MHQILPLFGFLRREGCKEITVVDSYVLFVTVDRMPVILGDERSTDEWLNGSLTKYDMLLKPYEKSDLVRSF